MLRPLGAWSGAAALDKLWHDLVEGNMVRLDWYTPHQQQAVCRLCAGCVQAWLALMVNGLSQATLD